MWDYLYFLVYLQHKEETEYTGAEQFVSSCLKAENLEWVPVNKALSMSGADEEYMEVHEVVETECRELGELLSGEIATVREQISELKVHLHRVTMTVNDLAKASKQEREARERRRSDLPEEEKEDPDDDKQGAFSNAVAEKVMEKFLQMGLLPVPSQSAQ